jgi:hypothetical protein
LLTNVCDWIISEHVQNNTNVSNNTTNKEYTKSDEKVITTATILHGGKA